MTTDDVFFHDGFQKWWPKFDHNPAGNYKTVMGGIGVIEEALPYIAGRELCVQAGGHLGYWPNKLARHFKTVWAFEPDPIVFECMVLNTERAGILKLKK